MKASSPENPSSIEPAEPASSTNPSAPSISKHTPRPAQKPPQLPHPKNSDQLRLATSAMMQRGISLRKAAGQYDVDPDDLHVWHRTYVNFIGRGALELNKTEPVARVEIDTETSRKFDENWDEMMRLAELERPQLSPLHRWMLRSRLTRWMFHGEQIDKITVVGALAAIAFTALAIKVGTSHRGDPEAPVSPAVTDPLAINLDDPGAFQRDDQQAALSLATEALNHFAKLPSWEERLPFIRNPQRLKPIMEAYYMEHADGPLVDSDSTLTLNSEVSFIKRKDTTFVLMHGTVEKNPGLEKPKKMIFFAEIVEEEPSVLFDWEILVNYSVVPFPEFVASKSTTTSTFRFRVARGDYYNQPFMDSDQYACYALLPLHGDRIFYGFVERGSPLGGKLDVLISKELNANRAMILKLRFPENAKYDNILEIESIQAEGWLDE